ncbi:MAG: trigger factor [Herbaspirillum sp.]
MATAVETLSKLERRITLTFPMVDVQEEVEKRLKARARTAKAPGFRPGKVPMKMVAAQFGHQVETEVLSDRLGRAFNDAAVENKLRVAGHPKIEAKAGEGVTDGSLTFDAIFEVYPEVVIGDLSSAEIEKITSAVSDAEIDKTLDILRRQRAHYHVKGEQSAHGDGGGGADPSAQNGDRATVDFVGKIDGIEFQGGKAEDFVFVLGEGRMLPEFEAAVIGLKVGESRTFPLTFPADYHGRDVAGKTAEFSMTLKQLEWAHLPEVDAEFARSLGVESGDLARMRADILLNLEREVSARTRAMTKANVMDALIKASELEVPKALIEQDIERLLEMAHEDMAQRGMDRAQLPRELFAAQAERRTRLGLILTEIVKANGLEATEEQVKAQVEDFAQSYEDPQQVLKYYFSDRDRLAGVKALVLEENVVSYVLNNARVSEKPVPFDVLMDNQAQAQSGR